MLQILIHSVLKYAPNFSDCVVYCTLFDAGAASEKLGSSLTPYNDRGIN